MTVDHSRRTALFSLAAGASALAGGSVHADMATTVIPAGAQEFSELMVRLGRAPRRRDFKAVPMILLHSDFWDNAAPQELLGYRGARKQVWDNTDIAGPWLNEMRNSINTQIFSFGHKDFLEVSATHGTAHLALFDEMMWEKYQLAAIAGAKFQSNSLIVPKAAPAALSDKEDPDSLFGPLGDTVPALQERGVVFLACHNAIWDLAERLITSARIRITRRTRCWRQSSPTISPIRWCSPLESPERSLNCSRLAFAMRLEIRRAAFALPCMTNL